MKSPGPTSTVKVCGALEEVEVDEGALVIDAVVFVDAPLVVCPEANAASAKDMNSPVDRR